MILMVTLKLPSTWTPIDPFKGTLMVALKDPL